MTAVWVRSCMFRCFHIGPSAEVRVAFGARGDSNILGTSQKQLNYGRQKKPASHFHVCSLSPGGATAVVLPPPAGQKPNCARNSKFMIITISPIFIIFIHLLKDEFEKHLGKQHQQSL